MASWLLKASLPAALTAFAPAMALSSATDLPLKLEDYGLDLSYTEMTSRDGNILLRDAMLAGEGVLLVADLLAYAPDTGLLRMRDVRITRPGESDVVMVVTDVTSSSLSSLQWVLSPALCLAGEEIDPRAIQLTLDGVALRTSDAGLPGVPSEELRISRLNHSFHDSSDGSCRHMSAMAAEGITVRSADGAVLTISEAQYSSNRQSGADLDISLSARDISSADTLNGASLSVSSLGLSVFIEEYPSGLRSSGLEVLSAYLGTSSGSVAFDLDGLRIVEGTSGSNMVSGDAMLKLDFDRAGLTYEADVSLPGYLSFSSSAGIDFTSGEGGNSLSMLAGEVPGIELAGRLALREFDFALHDEGLLEILEPVSGYGPSQVRGQAESLTARMPAHISAPILEFITDIFQGGAALRAQPEAPISVTQVVMTGLLQPMMVPQILGLERLE